MNYFSPNILAKIRQLFLTYINSLIIHDLYQQKTNKDGSR